MSETLQTVMLFGSFDGLHPGHEYLIGQARTHGDHLVIVVARDSVIAKTKNQEPWYEEQERVAQLTAMVSDATVVVGDEIEGKWTPIHQYQPDTIVIGYDQDALKRALEEIKTDYHFSIVQVDALEPENYKSSIIRQQKTVNQ